MFGVLANWRNNTEARKIYNEVVEPTAKPICERYREKEREIRDIEKEK